MKIIDPSFEFIQAPTRAEAYRVIAAAMRNCYRAELNAMPATDEQMVEKAVKLNHLSLLEFVDVAVNVTCDRGVTHELVRHRLCSFAQESTRYCNYSGKKFGRELTFVRPIQCSEQILGQHTIDWGEEGLIGIREEGPINPELAPADNVFFWNQAVVERDYMNLLDCGWSPQEARAVLPNSLAAKIAVKANLREWIHIFRMRCDTPAHPDMRATMKPILVAMLDHYPHIFQPVYNWLANKGALK